MFKSGYQYKIIACVAVIFILACGLLGLAVRSQPKLIKSHDNGQSANISLVDKAAPVQCNVLVKALGGCE